MDLLIEDQISKEQDTQSTSFQTTTMTAPKLNNTNVLTFTNKPKQESWETERMITTSTATPLTLTTTSTTTTSTTSTSPTFTSTTQSVTNNRSTTISATLKTPKPHHNTTSATRKHTVKSRLSWDEESAATTDLPKNSGMLNRCASLMY